MINTANQYVSASKFVFRGDIYLDADSYFISMFENGTEYFVHSQMVPGDSNSVFFVFMPGFEDATILKKKDAILVSNNFGIKNAQIIAVRKVMPHDGTLN